MLRSSLLLALFALPVLAQRSPSIALGDPAGRPAMQEVNLDTVHVRASPEGTNALGLQGGRIDPTFSSRASEHPRHAQHERVTQRVAVRIVDVEEAPFEARLQQGALPAG